MGSSTENLAGPFALGASSVTQSVSAESVSQTWRVAATILFFAVLANIPYWLAAEVFRFEHLGWFALEFGLVGILGLYAPPVLTWIATVVVISSDLLLAVCKTYYLQVEAALPNMMELHSVSASRLVVIAAVTLLIAGTVFAAGYLPRHWVSRKSRKVVVVWLFGFMVFAHGFDLVHAVLQSGGKPSLQHLRPTGDGLALGMGNIPILARDPVIRLLHMEQFDRHVMGLAVQADTLQAMPSAADRGLRDGGIGAATSANTPNIVLVVVESWGFSKNEQINSALQAPYHTPEIAQRYRIETGTVPFFSSTVPGEVRELCGNTSAFHVLQATQQELQNCLPRRLEATGYHTVALHGMNGNLFSRSNWYPTMGFQEILFHDDFEKQGLPDCKSAFDGICDADLADWMRKRLERPSAQPQLLYWVTLNSHLPVFVPSGVSNAAPCSADLNIPPDSPLCSWYQLVENVHRAMAQVALGNFSRPTVFILVGDHAPPFGSPERRNLFSQDTVPYLILLPR